MNNRKKWKSTFKSMIFGCLLYLGCALIFVGSGIGHSYIVRQNAQNASHTLTVNSADKNKKTKTSYDASKTKSIDVKELWRTRQYPVSPIGRLSVPAVNIHDPLFNGYGAHNQNLSYGVVTVVPGRYLGRSDNYVLAGHYMGQYGPAVLDNLHLMQKGDIIYVTDMHRIYAYKATAKSYSIKPNQVEIENNQRGKGTITLITCSDFDISRYGYGKHRTVVQGTLVGSIAASKHALENTELTDKDNQSTLAKSKRRTAINPITKKAIKVRPAARSKIYQNASFDQITVTFTILWAIFMIIIFTRIWVLRKC